MWKDPETNEEIDTGLCRVKAVNSTEGGKAIDVGGGNAFGGAAEDDEGVDDQAETKLDQFWTFPAIENEIRFSSFAEFKKSYFMPFLLTFQQLAVSKGACKDEADMKAKGKQLANNAAKWIKANWDELQFYSLESYMQDGEELDEKYKGKQFAANVAIVRYEGENIFFYFFRSAFKEDKF